MILNESTLKEYDFFMITEKGEYPNRIVQVNHVNSLNLYINYEDPIERLNMDGLYFFDVRYSGYHIDFENFDKENKEIRRIFLPKNQNVLCFSNGYFRTESVILGHIIEISDLEHIYLSKKIDLKIN